MSEIGKTERSGVVEMKEKVKESRLRERSMERDLSEQKEPPASFVLILLLLNVNYNI